FFSLMVGLLAEIKGEQVYRQYLPQMQKEYDFWMDGQQIINREKRTQRRVVYLDENTTLNRYWDDRPEPRPESFKEDVELQESSKREAEQLYRDLRAACESGWDFSSRWLRDAKNLESIFTTEIIPVDLNCLLYNLEWSLSRAYALSQNQDQSKFFQEKAQLRKAAILQFCWNGQFFMDYDFVKKQTTDKYTLAGAFPLFFEIAEKKQAKKTAKKIKADFLKPGGLVTTLNNSGQQWDSPNGWAPLQWVTIKGLKNYGQNSIAEQAAQNWVNLNTRVFKNTGKMVEKYNVVDINLEAGGGEYENQDGFGWTNGVFLKILKDQR
ncbi:MAG: trehalase family glycosidase, partial [Bacteroidota bacterium]